MSKGRSRREARFLEAKARRRRRILAAVGAAIVAVVVVVVVVVASGGGGDEPVVAQLTLDDYSIAGELEVPAGDIRLEAVNVGEIPHNVGLRGGPISREFRPGDGGSVDIGDLAPGSYELYCDVIGHEDLGMVATLTVTEPGPESQEN